LAKVEGARIFGGIAAVFWQRVEDNAFHPLDVQDGSASPKTVVMESPQANVAGPLVTLATMKIYRGGGTQLSAKLNYTRRNPVAAGLCARAEDWPWIIDPFRRA
jgi:hypothetical protein